MRRSTIPACRAAVAVLGASLLFAASLSAMAQAPTPASTTPVPRQDNWWTKRHKASVERAKKGDVDLLFLGDSITQGWNDNETWKEYYEPRKAANFGFSGDRTQHVLWRIENGEIDGIKPRGIVLMIGTNNAGADSAEDIAAGITRIVSTLREKLPDSNILLLGVFPRGEEPNPVREKLDAVNAQIAKLDDGGKVHYLDIGPSFLEDDGTISKDVMPDFLHLSAEGYKRWAKAIEPAVKHLLGE